MCQTKPYSIERFVDGPPLRLGLASFGNHADGSMVGVSGSTVVTTTACTSPPTEPSGSHQDDGSTAFTVDVRYRTHGVGRVPQNRGRRDYAAPTEAETLASRAVDRALRPLLRTNVHRLHVQSVVQSYDAIRSSGHPVAASINAAAAACGRLSYLTESVAATNLCIMQESSSDSDSSSKRQPEQYEGLYVVQDPTPQQVQESLGQLLLAGTRDRVVMMEWTSCGSGNSGLPEECWPMLLQVGMAALQPLLDAVEEAIELQLQEPIGITQGTYSKDDVLDSLGLLVAAGDEDTIGQETLTTDKAMEELQNLVERAVLYCDERLHLPLARLFGVRQDRLMLASTRCSKMESIVHIENNLLPKAFRAARESAMQTEIKNAVNNFLIQSEIDLNIDDRTKLQDKVTKRLFKASLLEAIKRHGVRSDQRGLPGTGWKTIRPIALHVPALPNTVHGSALFARGETQVLSTVTLAPPSDGMLRTDVYQFPDTVDSATDDDRSAYSSLPVGSLRFLRSQEALTSDLNSRKIQVDKEPTGASGNLFKLKRAFLQYDFPSYSTGKVPEGNQASKRRSVGHGNLAERAILPLLPTAEEFPYTIRMTSEVTDSNGSSSMASVCGVTLALLDAGVPLLMPVAGVSVGAVSDGQDYALMLDITGTEDYFGAMDFKVAGTSVGVTAFQLDVKEPLPEQAIVEALFLARLGRRSIFDAMEKACSSLPIHALQPRLELKETAPRVEVVRFDPQRKRDAVGPGGIILRQLEDRYGVSLDLTQEGRCLIHGFDKDKVRKAKLVIMDLVSDVAVGDTHVGTVIEIKDFGAIIELLRNKEGLLHVSEMSNDADPGSHPQGLSGFVRDRLTVGQEVAVRVIGVDPVQGNIKLSMKQLAH